MEHPSDSYTWKLNTATATKIPHMSYPYYFQSPIVSMIGFTWYIVYVPEYDTEKQEAFIFLHLNAFPDTLSNIAVNYIVSIPEANFVFHGKNKSFIEADDSWGFNQAAGKELFAKTRNLHSTQLTLKLDLVLNAVQDKNGKDVTKEYIEKCARQQPPAAAGPINNVAPIVQSNAVDEATRNQAQMNSVRLDSMSMQLDALMSTVKEMQSAWKQMQAQKQEEEKNDLFEVRMKILERELNEVKQMSMKAASSSVEPVWNEKQREMKLWLENEVGHGEYFDVFVQNGIGDLSTVRLLNMDVIKGIGIEKIGHQIKILNEVIKLKQKHDVNEGGTAFL